MQFGIFDVDNRLRRLSKMGDALERINRIVDWEMFRPIIESALKESRGKAQAADLPLTASSCSKFCSSSGCIISVTTRRSTR